MPAKPLRNLRSLLVSLHVRPSAQAIPLAAGCLRACLPEHLRHDCQLLDFYATQGDAEILQAILAEQPQVIAFSLYLWNRTALLRLCRQLRQQRPDLILIAGGPEASADSRRVIQEGELDGVICGEGESAFAELLEQLAAGRQPAGIEGFVAAGNSAGQTSCTALCPDLTSLPSPWLQGDLPLAEGAGVLWEVARGCHFNCAFCYDAKGHQGVRPLPLERLQAELELFVASGVSQVWVLDSTFNAPAERGKQLLMLLAETAPQIHFHFEAKADFLDSETAELLSHLSCSVQIGLQAAEPEVLKNLKRDFKAPQMVAALSQLSQFGVTFGLDLIYGLPGDNHAGFCRSLDFALQQQPNQVDIFPLAVLPGTELYHHQEEFGLQAMHKPPYLVEENRSYAPEQLERSRQLALAADIFYNRGRAVGYFLQLCQALQLAPAELLSRFFSWLTGREKTNADQLAAEDWQPAGILPLQQEFIAAELATAGLSKLQPLLTDLLNYHYCCAEVLLAGDCPATNSPAPGSLHKQRWRLHPAVRLQQFHYDLEELERLGGYPLKKLQKQLHPAENLAIFFQRGGELISEALQEDFARLLQAAVQHPRSGAQLVKSAPPGEGDEYLDFAVAEGLLQSVT